MSKRKGLIIIIVFIIACMTIFVWKFKNINHESKMQSYSDKDFNFSVEFPDDWESKVMERWGSTSTQEASPDGGIDIYINGNKNDRISVYGQCGHIGIPKPSNDSTEFTTKYGNKGILYSQTNGSLKEMHLIFDEGFHSAYLNMSTSCYKKNEKEIIAVLKSINIKSNTGQFYNKELQVTDKSEYPFEIPIGTNCTVDLNNDGSKDSVSYMVDKTETTNQINIRFFTVNNIDYKDKLFGELGFYMDNPNLEHYFIADIDKTDNLKEIAILDEGPSGDPQTYFYRYNGHELKYIGSVPDFPKAATCYFDGNGTVIASCRLNILQTWWAPAKWRMDESGYLKKVHEDIYYPYQYPNDTNPVILLKDLPIYKRQDLKADQITVRAGSKVTFTATDNEHWVYIKTQDGVEGWFYMDNYGILLNGKQVDSRSIFENLNYAD